MSFVLRSPVLANCLKTRQIVFLTSNSSRQALLNNARLFGNNSSRGAGRSGAGRVFAKQTIEVKKPTRTLKEILMQPTSGAPFAFGSASVAAASVVGLGALCYYGLGLSNSASTFENAHAWPQFVRDRVKSTYFYFGSGLAITAASATAAFRSPLMMRLMTKNSFGSIALTIGAMIGTSILAQSIPYQEGFGMKQMAWALHCGVVGTVIAPLCIMGGPLLLRAALYTAGIAGGLSTIAYCAPNDKFLYMGGPLAIGLGAVFAASLGSMFLPPTTALGAGLYSISLYGGLLLFSAFLLYDTQKIVRKAETHPYYSMTPFDPVNASISIYMDVINIFVRILAILSGSNKKR